MAMDWDALYRTVDEHLRHGRPSRAQAALDKIQDVKVPREEAARFAAVARRADRASFGIRLLNPIVRSDRKAPVEATEEEKAEYAQCLIRIGASEEATILLDSIASSRIPQVLLYRASAHIQRWEYEEAVPLLKAYVRREDLAPYQALVGKVNLAAALAATKRHEKATFLIRELLHETSLKQYATLHANLLSVATQHFALRKKWADVTRCLAKAKTVLAESDGEAAFFLEKWKALAAMMRDPKSAEALAEVDAVREKARARGHWDTLRQCDELQGIHTKDEARLVHLYFGTPYESWRRRMLDDFSDPKALPGSYAWNPSGHPTEGVVLDLLTGETEGGKRATLKTGQLLHRLAVTLSSDFYRPLRLASVHFQLYPGEYFNPVTSPFRVYEAVKRLRAWLEKSSLPLAIEEENGFYRLTASGPGAIRVYRAKDAVGKHAAALMKLRERFAEAPFSIGEACEVLAMPSRSAQRLLEAAMTEGHVSRSGQSRATRYRLA